MTDESAYGFEDSTDGRWLVVTGHWSGQAADVLSKGDANGLVLNYARGFTSDDGLEFLDGRWNLRRLDVLDRKITDLTPIERLSDSLEDLSIQAAPSAQVDLAALPHLHNLGGTWSVIGSTLSAADQLQSISTWEFGEADLHAFRDHFDLVRLTVKDAPRLESLSGLANLSALEFLGVFFAPKLHDVGELVDLASTLRELHLQSCRGIDVIDDLEPLTNLRLLSIANCGDIASLAPIASLELLETLLAWESTRIVDGDLSPLAGLPRLKEVRMQNRRGYTPTVAELRAALPA